MIKVTAIVKPSGEGHKKVFFRTETDEEIPSYAWVCVARTPFAKGKDSLGRPRSSYVLNELHTADHRAPSLSVSSGELDNYLARVQSDIEKVVNRIRNEPKEIVLFEG